MAAQNYKNHIRYYIPHHFIFYPVCLLLMGWAAGKAIKSEGQATVWWLFLICVFLIAMLSFMMRQHYALTNQNRIVRLEMRHKYFVLSKRDFESLEQQLSFGQIAALRFAPDDELLQLIERTLKEKLQPGDIKKAIKNWKPDGMRV